MISQLQESKSLLKENRSKYGVALLGAGVFTYVVVRLSTLMTGVTFYFDEWDFVQRRPVSIESLLRAHNGHLSALPVAVYQFFFQIFGLDSYRPYQIMILLVHLILCLVVFLACRSHGQIIAISAALTIALLGAGWQNIFWPFQIGMIGSAAAGLYALHLFAQGSKKHWQIIICLTASLMCSGGGIAVIAGVLGVTLLNRRWKLLYQVLAVVAVYLLWYLKYGEPQATSTNISKIPKYVYDSAVFAATGLGTTSTIFGGLLLGVLLTLLLSNFKKNIADPIIVGASLIAVAGWVLTALARAQYNDPGATRYVYIGATYLIVIFARTLPNHSKVWSSSLSLTAAILFVLSSSSTLNEGANFMRDTSRAVLTEISVMEMLRNKVEPSFRPDTSRAPQIVAGEYFAAIDAHDSPGKSENWIAQQDNWVREVADQKIFEILKFGENLTTQINDSECVSASPMTDIGRMAPAGSSIAMKTTKPILIKFSRFADTTTENTAIQTNAVGVIRLELPKDRIQTPWVIKIGEPSDAMLCSAEK
jgi:hypothetical protein